MIPWFERRLITGLLINSWKFLYLHFKFKKVITQIVLSYSFLYIKSLNLFLFMCSYQTWKYPITLLYRIISLLDRKSFREYIINFILHAKQSIIIFKMLYSRNTLLWKLNEYFWITHLLHDHKKKTSRV